MVQIIAVSVVFVLCALLIYPNYIKPGIGTTKGNAPIDWVIFLAILFAGVVTRYIATGFYDGFPNDMACFDSWSENMFKNGAGAFYESSSFSDYPPGYMYVLWVLGAIKSVVDLPRESYYVLLKTPAIICDIVIAVMLYRFAVKYMSNKAAAALGAFWIFNPAVVLNSSLWGQVDSFYTLFVFVCILLVFKKKLIPAFFAFAAAVMIKPQSLFYTPILIFAIIDESIYPVFEPKKLLKYIAGGVGAILFMLMIALPFGLDNVFEQYVKTLSSYPYFTVNAYNLWAAFGLNWAKLNTAASLMGPLLIVIIVIVSAMIYYKCKGREKYFFVSAFICFMVFMLSTKMHDRYGYPAMIFLLAAYAVCGRTSSFAAYTAVSATQFFNAAYILFYYNSKTYYSSIQPQVAIAGGFAAIIACAVVLYAAKEIIDGKEVMAQEASSSLKKSEQTRKSRFEWTPVSSLEDYKMTKKDAIILCSLIAVYSVIALWNLGDIKAPQSGITLENESIELKVGAKDGISQMRLYIGPYHINENNTMTVTFFDENNTETARHTIEKESVFEWEMIDIDVPNAEKVTFSTEGKVQIIEAAFVDKNGQLITDLDNSPIFDEQELVPDRSTYLNGTYFDEIYHARTAYEFVHGIEVYEWTHPPLGKVLISIGIEIFGMTPFGWRIIGTLFGIFMIPAIYLFAKKMFGRTDITAFCAVLFTFDFMHFAQTRISTIDVYVTFFIILMYLFMLMYYRMSFYDTPLRKTFVPLGLCGICFGLGAASKWTGLYAGAGLAVIFFITLYRRYKEYEYALAQSHQSSSKAENKHIIECFPKYAKSTVLFCVIFFVLIPAAIYLLSYIPFMNSNGTGIAGVIKNQTDMFRYHSNVTQEHSFSSSWYQWPIMYRPIWFYSGTVSDTVKEGISSFGNPLVWWVGIPAFFYTAYMAFAKRDKSALFLTIGYLAQLLPWIPVTRITFIYHYFPCVPFVAMMLAYSAKNILGEKKWGIWVLVGYALLAVILFAMFYPVLSGHPVEVEYVKNFLKWSSKWVLVSGS